ncbi:hypothetical protein E1B28_001727 [Marasmius oreades]|uniref:Uncharacterized protein n=1 Tax=Marasmius oreades TaxID=181124 RepID=A0A9P7V472_9AGAR|nr:uncharacterized protein E1B28_001727 [Marasmius oreades]KAG7099934.1 hypothetical protein E1B28_001727 [Marasmius oreades]
MGKNPVITVQDSSSPTSSKKIKRTASDGSRKKEKPEVDAKAGNTAGRSEGKNDGKNKASSLAVPGAKQPDVESKKVRSRSVTPDPPSKKVKKPSPTPATTIDKSKTGTYTDLEPVVKIPWDDTFCLGHGVNALTGESTASCALTWNDKSFKFAERRIARSKTSIDVIHWNDLKNLVDGYELEAGVGTGTINVALHPALEFRAKLASVLTNSSSAKTVLVQYHAYGGFETQFLPRDVALRPDLHGISTNEFRERYGDYYIAGHQDGFSCRAVIVCRIKESATSDSQEAIAKAHIEKILSVGISASDSKTESQECTLLHAVIDSRGCSPEVNSLASINDMNSIADTLKSLTQSMRNPLGTKFTALLHHYSTLDHNILPRRIDGIQDSVFAKAREMREYYAHLQAFLIHPALRNFKGTRDNINRILKTFELARRDLLLRQPKSKTYPDYESMYKEFKGLIERSSTLDSRYEFIRGVKNMDCSIRTFVPMGSNRIYRWECGKTGGKVTDNVCGFQVVGFEPGHKAYEITWSASVTALSKRQMLLKKLGGSGDAQYMEFRVLPTTEVAKPPVIRKAKGHGIFGVPYNNRSGDSDDGDDFLFRMVGGPVFVLGWTLSCEWEGSRDDKPVIKVQGENNFILSDHLGIRLDTSRPARWTCQITFVFQCSFNFPDLNLQSGGGDGLMAEANRLLPSPPNKITKYRPPMGELGH